MRGKPTMNDVAIEAVVSLGTVSKVLRGDTTVAAELRERVLAACRSLKYQRNWIAASLRNRQTDTIGIIIPDILNTFYATLVEKLENLASAGGYTVVIVTTGEEPQRALQRINVVKDRQVDGVIVVPSVGSSETLVSSIGSDMPCVIVDRVASENPFPSVATDNFDAAYQGARYLLSLGHRHVVIAANTPRLWNTHQRIAGFDAAAVVEVIEHLDEPRLASFERVLFEFARPTTIIVTTPNVEYNVRFETLPAGQFRHKDHRFEWTRRQFQDWANGVAGRFGYNVRFLPVGAEDAKVGPATQMAVFARSQ